MSVYNTVQKQLLFLALINRTLRSISKIVNATVLYRDSKLRYFQILTDVNKALINSIGAVGISNDGSCSMTDCLQNPEANQWCRLSAVCKKLVGYAMNLVTDLYSGAIFVSFITVVLV